MDDPTPPVAGLDDLDALPANAPGEPEALVRRADAMAEGLGVPAGELGPGAEGRCDPPRGAIPPARVLEPKAVDGVTPDLP